ncbi:MAG: small metal-binding protein SmbP [Methylocystis sp.]|nr:small metal-binding protein SmbP [Methylocystis sp.]
MKRKQTIVTPLVCLFLGLAAAPAFALSSAHVAAAIEHAEQAVAEDVKADAKQMLDHVRGALGHAREALHEKALRVDRAANDILHRVVRHLRQAEMQARFNKPDKAAGHVNGALAELRKIN